MPNNTEGRLADDERVVEWSHETVIHGEQPRAMARAFVCPHLVEHGLFKLVDIVQLVAGELAADAIVRANPPVTMSLSKTGEVVRLEVQDTPPAPDPGSAAPRDAEDFRSRFVELLSLQWGLSPGVTRGVWVTFDAHPQRHAVHAARRIENFTRGRVPGVDAYDPE